MLAAAVVGLSLSISPLLGLTPHTRADTSAPSPGPISTVQPLPCPSRFTPTRIGFPTRIEFVLTSAPKGHVPHTRNVTAQGPVRTLYQYLCALPAVDPQYMQCVSGAHKVEYDVRMMQRKQEMLRLHLDLGGCQLASRFAAGYSYLYRVPDRATSQIAHVLHVPAKRLSPVLQG
jgi:hypothetical protein